MAIEISVNELKACARDLNITMDLIPRIPITNASKSTLMKVIKQVSTLIQPQDQLKPETEETLKKLKTPDPKPSSRIKKDKKKIGRPKKRKNESRKENDDLLGKSVSLRITELVCENFDITYKELEEKLTLESYKFTRSTVYVRRTEVLRAINILRKLGKLREE